MKISLLLILATSTLFACKTEPERILIKLEKGQKYTQHMVSKSTSSQTIMGKAMTNTSISDAVNTTEVIDVSDSIYTFKITFQSMSVKTIKDGDTTTLANNPMTKVLNGLKGKSYLTKMSNTGRVIETIGADSLFSKIFDSMPGVPDGVKAAMTKRMTDEYGDKGIKQNSQMYASLYPNKVVKEGDTWTAIRAGGSDVMMPEVKAVYKLDKITGSEYLVSMKANLSVKTDDKSVDSTASPIKFNLYGTMNSTNKIDKKTGLVMETKMKQDILGNIKLSKATPGIGETTIPMQVKGETMVTNTFIK